MNATSSATRTSGPTSSHHLRILYCTSSLAFDADMTLERAHPPNQLGQPRDHRRVAAPLSNFHGGTATDHDVVIQIIVDTGLCRDHHAIADVRMIGASRLSAELAPLADFHRTGDSNLRRKPGELADFAAMADMHMIVELHASMKNRRTHHRAIHSRVRSDFDVIF